MIFGTQNAQNYGKREATQNPRPTGSAYSA